MPPCDPLDLIKTSCNLLVVLPHYTACCSLPQVAAHRLLGDASPFQPLHHAHAGLLAAVAPLLSEVAPYFLPVQVVAHRLLGEASPFSPYIRNLPMVRQMQRMGCTVVHRMNANGRMWWQAACCRARVTQIAPCFAGCMAHLRLLP